MVVFQFCLIQYRALHRLRMGLTGNVFSQLVGWTATGSSSSSVDSGSCCLVWWLSDLILHYYLGVKGTLLGSFAGPIFTTNRLWGDEFFVNNFCLIVTDGSFTLIGYLAARVLFTRWLLFIDLLMWMGNVAGWNSEIIRPRWQRNAGSSLDPGALSLTKVEEQRRAGALSIRAGNSGHPLKKNQLTTLTDHQYYYTDGPFAFQPAIKHCVLSPYLKKRGFPTIANFSSQAKLVCWPAIDK